MDLTVNSTETRQKRGAARLVLWIYIASMGMMFAGLTSAFIVKKAEGPWRAVELPSMFYVSTALLLLSSATIHLALTRAKANKISATQVLLGGTLAIGIAFLFSQILGFSQLVSQNVYLVGNPGESFVYVLTGLHGLHILAALIILIVVLVQAVRLRIGADHTFGLSQAVTFWHALDVLWLYLFLFLLVNQT